MCEQGKKKNLSNLCRLFLFFIFGYHGNVLLGKKLHNSQGMIGRDRKRLLVTYSTFCIGGTYCHLVTFFLPAHFAYKSQEVDKKVHLDFPLIQNACVVPRHYLGTRVMFVLTENQLAMVLLHVLVNKTYQQLEFDLHGKGSVFFYNWLSSRIMFNFNLKLTYN